MSHQYGNRFLKAGICKEDYTHIYDKLSKEGKRLLEDFYELDENFTEQEIFLLKTKKEISYQKVQLFLK